jgi:hypothetical protein
VNPTGPAVGAVPACTAAGVLTVIGPESGRRQAPPLAAGHRHRSRTDVPWLPWITVSAAATLTDRALPKASPATAGPGSRTLSWAVIGWIGWPAAAEAGKLAVMATVTWTAPAGKAQA